MSAETNRSYILSPFCIGWSSLDTAAADGEKCAPFMGITTWVGTQANREWLVPINCQLFNFAVRISANNNTADGATIVTELDDGATLLLVTIDQADGNFQDTTNRVNVTALQTLNCIYNQGNNTFTPHSVGWCCQPL